MIAGLCMASFSTQLVMCSANGAHSTRAAEKGDWKATVVFMYCGLQESLQV